MSYRLTNENYTICVSDGKIYHIKPDESGRFSIDLPKGVYRIWVDVTLGYENTSRVAVVPYLYIYPMKTRPITVNPTDDEYLEIKPEKIRWNPPEPIMPNTKLRIVGHVYNPENFEFTIKLYMTDKPIYLLKTIVRGCEFKFENVLPAANYTVEVVPSEVMLSNGIKVIYEKTYINFKLYVTPKHQIVTLYVNVPYRIVQTQKSPSFELPLALIVMICLAFRRILAK